MTRRSRLFRRLLALLAMTAAAGHAGGQTRLEFAPPERLAAPGAFRVPVTMAHAAAVAGVQFEIYDAQAALRLDSVRTTGRSQHLALRRLDRRVLLYGDALRTIAAGEGPILELYLTVAPGATGFDSLVFKPFAVVGDPDGLRVMPLVLGGTVLDLRTGTGVAGGDGGPPDTPVLYPPYPNPFNGALTIEFELPQPAGVDIGLYDLLGRRAATLLAGRFEAGRHRLSRPAGDLGSGLYWCCLQVDGARRLHKVLLLK